MDEEPRSADFGRSKRDPSDSPVHGRATDEDQYSFAAKLRPSRALLRPLREGSTFFVLTAFLLLIAIASTRAYLSIQTIHNAIATSNIDTLLAQRTLPFRHDTSQALIAVVQSLAEDRSADTATLGSGGGYVSRASDHYPPPVDSETDEATLHEAFNTLSKVLNCGPLDKGPPPEAALPTCGTDARLPARRRDCVRESVSDAARLVGRLTRGLRVDSASGPRTAIEPLAVEFERSYWATDKRSHFPLVPCPPTEGRVPNVHETLYGRALCDPVLPGNVIIPSRVLGDSQPTGESTAGDDGDPRCRLTDRLLQANDFSRLIHDVIGEEWAKDATVRTVEPGPRHLRPLVGAYFLSVDSLFRYWAPHDPKPSDFAERWRLWGMSPFVALPLAHQETFFAPFQPSPRSRFQSPEGVANLLCSPRTIPSLPYIDYGGNGIVRTKCSCAVDGDGALIGVFCTDRAVSIWPMSDHRPDTDRKEDEAESTSGMKPLIDGVQWIIGLLIAPPPDAENKLLRRWWVEMPAAPENQCAEHVHVESYERESNSHGSAAPVELPHGTEEALCGGLQANPEGFFLDVQRLETPLESVSRTFFIPIDRATAPGRDTQRGLVIQPAPATPPRKPAVVMILAWTAVFLAFVGRGYVEISMTERSRDDSILRSLPGGVIEAVDSWHLIAGNDRAEELLGGSLRGFGADRDSIGDREIDEFVDLTEIVDAEKWDHDSTRNVLTKDQISDKRKQGLQTGYYVRRWASSIDTGEGEADAAWLRIDGTPFLEDEDPKRDVPRTFAVIGTVPEARQAELNRKPDQGGGGKR